MKKQKFLLGAAGLLAISLGFGLTACSNDADLKMENQKVEIDQTRFLAIQISAPRDAATRTFEDGATNESYVARLDFLFYDVDGNPTSNPQTISSFAGNNFQNGPFEGGNVTRIYTSVVPVQLTQGQNLPSQVLCIVNGDAGAIDRLQSMTLEQIRGVQQADFLRQQGANADNQTWTFLMSNSVYYGLNVLNGTPNDRLCATPINTNTQLFETRDQAQAAITGTDTGLLVNIYVERLAAKVGLNMTADAPKTYTLVNGDVEDYQTIDLHYVPEYWLMNATDDDNYLTKHYGVDTDGDINFTPDYQEINTALSNAGFSTWNDPNNHRSYWGASPSYFDDSFPLVSDQVYDPEAHENAPFDYENAKVYPVTYYTYNNVVTEAGRSSIRKQALIANAGAFTASTTEAGGVSTSTGFIYTRETTTPRRTIRNIQNGNPAAAVASAVIVGHYNVGEEANRTTFYIDRNNGTITTGTGDNTQTHNNGTYYGSLASVRNALVARQTIIYSRTLTGTDADNNPIYSYSLVDAARANIFTVKHPNAAARAELANSNIAGRLATLQFDVAPTGEGNVVYYYDAERGDYVAVTATNLPKVNAQLISTGYVEMFYNGLAFFSIPIRHINWDDESYNNTTKQYDWANMNTGELGVVRNHVYNINVTEISGLGNALRSPNQPIVPAKDAVNQYIAMKLNILSWNIAQTWDVNL